MLSLDTETTGVDFYHGSRPFFVTTCDEEGNQQWWEWDVDPLTRQPRIPEEDVLELCGLLEGANYFVLQNAKFDITALSTIKVNWEGAWARTYDTLIAGHLLASNQPHDLTSMAIQYLGIDISEHEIALKETVQECRRLVHSRFPEWRIAKKGQPDMPSAKEKAWGYDYWLPRAVSKELGYSESHPWQRVLRDYANADSAVTMRLWKQMRLELERKELWAIFQEKMKQPEVVWEMERRGVTVLVPALKKMQTEYTKDCDTAEVKCKAIASKHSYDLELPKGSAVNGSLKTFLFDTLHLPILSRTPTGAPAFSKEVIDVYKKSLVGEPLEFVKALSGKRKRGKSLEFLSVYENLGIRNGCPGVIVLHPNLNPTATSTTRFSCDRPNLQQVSKQETDCETCLGEGCKVCNGTGQDLKSVRRVFGPAPGREWWKMDAENIELRIPAYASGQLELIDLFERPTEPPFYGSQHLLNFSVVYPDIWETELRAVGLEKVGPHIKKKYVSSWYQSCKNGGFAIQYQCGQETADRTFKRPGSFNRLKSTFDKLEALNQKYIAFAYKYGYVETLPDKTVNPKRGYPLMVERGDHGRPVPTLPLDYVSQGTAGWWMVKAMNRCHVQLKNWRTRDKFDGWMILTVHDELLFDFPFRPNRGNLWRAQLLRKSMARGGDDIGVPTPVSLEYCPKSWGEGEAV